MNKNKAGKLLSRLYKKGFTLEPIDCFCMIDTADRRTKCCDEYIIATFVFSPRPGKEITIDCCEAGDVFLDLSAFGKESEYYVLGDPGKGFYKQVDRVDDLVDLILEFANAT